MGGGGMMAPQNVFDHCAQTRKEEAETLWLLILIYGASKKLFLVP